MQSRGAGLMILVLDACRNNPLTAVETTQALADGRPLSSLTRALPTTLMRGLTLPQIPTDVVGIYSAGFGQTALDNLPSDRPEQKNSVFVRVFAAKIKQPGVSLFEVMPDVQTEVADLAATVNEPDGPHLQTPAFLSQSRRQIYLAGLPPRSAPGSVEAPPAQPAPAIDPAAQAWAATQSTTSEAVLEDFIRQFGSTVYGSMARARLAELKTSKLAAAVSDAIARGDGGAGVGGDQGHDQRGRARSFRPPVRVHRLRQHGAGASGGIEQEQSCCGRATSQRTDQ